MEFLVETMPLALLPFCGKSLIDHTLSELATDGFHHIDIYFSDRPELIREQLRNGEKWGLQLSYHPTKHETNKEAISQNYLDEDGEIGTEEIYTLDRCPIKSHNPLFRSYHDLFKNMRDHMAVAGSNQLGITEHAPGIWIGIGARIPANAKLKAPCWIGRNVYLGTGVQIGPGSIIEDECLIDDRSIIEDSQVTQRTYVGSDTELRESIAWGPRLVNWKSNSTLVVQDPFLLSRLDDTPNTSGEYRPGLTGRILALLLLIATLPIGLVTALFLRLIKDRAFISNQATVPHRLKEGARPRVFTFYDFNTERILLRRLPRIWSILKGDMAWVGNPPIAPKDLDLLQSEFDRLWLAAPCGLVSLGDCYHCTDVTDQDARTHAAYFAVKPNRNLNAKILAWLLLSRQL
jgi:hypothetical protein